MASLRFTAHARRQMERRSITATEVDEALAAAETSYPSAQHPDTRLVVLGTTNTGRRLKVVVAQDDPHYVITAAARDEDDE
jgi:hypothetical protein